MEIKEVLSNWKAILTFIIVIVGGTYSVLTWAEGEKALIRAEQQLMHNEMYQESRITRKNDQIQDNLKTIKIIESDDDELSVTEQKLIESLTLDIKQLLRDIEEIRAKLITGNE